MFRSISYITALLLLLEVNLTAQEVTGERTLTLEECVQMASESNVSIKNTHLDYLSAKMLKREVLSNYFPNVNVQAMGFYALNPLVRIGLSDILGSSDAANNFRYYAETTAQLNGLKTVYETLGNAYGAAITLTQPVYAGGRIINGNRLAALGIKAASLNESIARRDIGSDIGQKYYLVVSLEEKLKLVDDALALSESILKDAESALENGLATEADKDEAIIFRQDFKAKKIRLKGSLTLARMNLCNAVGLNSMEAFSLSLADRLESIAPPQAHYKDPSAIVQSLAESQLLDLAVRRKELEKKMAMGEALPEVGVGASYSYGHLIGSPQTNGMLYATVKIPITDWSKAANKMKNLDYQAEKAINDKAYLCSMLELDIRRRWVEVESCWEELQLHKEKTAHAQDLLGKAEADLDAGIGTISQVLSRRTVLSEAQSNLIDARIAYANAIAAFKSRCGL